MCTGRTRPGAIRFSTRPHFTTRICRGRTLLTCCRPNRLTRPYGSVPSRPATRLFVANGYAHVIAQPRGSGKSAGHYGHEDTDHYDTIEWITHQPWCDGNVGMVGISGYAGEQWRAAEQGHPARKAIFPYDACSAY